MRVGHIKINWQLAVLIILIISLAGCAKVEDKPLRISSHSWIGYEPLFLARSMGTLNPEQFRLIEYRSATQSMNGLLDGTIEAATLTLDEAIRVKQQGADIKILLILDTSNGGDGIVVKPGIENLAQLKGKRIATETTALGAYMLHRILQHAELTPQQIKLHSSDYSQHLDAFSEPHVDAVVTYEPALSQLVAQGGKVLFESSQLPGEIVDVMVIRSDAIATHRPKIATLVKVWYQTIAHIQQSPDETNKMMAKRMKVELPVVLQSLQTFTYGDENINRHLLLDSEAGLAKQAEQLQLVMLRAKLLESKIDAQQLFDATLLKELHR